MAFGFTSAAIKQALVDYGEELEDREVGTGVAYLRALRDRCLAKFNEGVQLEYVSTTVDGQTFQAEVKVTAADLLAAASDALREVSGEAVKLTYPQFCGIPH
jgi:hypothetical protein